jgi:hypothetical protein
MEGMRIFSSPYRTALAISLSTYVGQCFLTIQNFELFIPPRMKSANNMQYWGFFPDQMP